MYAADARHVNKALAEKLAHIYTLRGGPTIDLTIRKPYLELLEKLGNPHLNMPPVIHVAGTNGKGSTIAFLKAILNAAGYSVHTYTSPHLYQFNERITLADKHIDDTLLETTLDEVMAVNNGEGLTFFEVTTAIAFLAFSRVKADIVLLETGLGGRLDCTNVIAKPLATIITAIGYDHTEFLGDTLTAIATEKAGIIKQNTPCIIGAQTASEVYEAIESKAKILNAPVIRAPEEWPQTLPDPALIGPHQKQNALNAITALKNQNIFAITEDHIKEGLKTATWAGRLQKTKTSAPFELWYDGGHNENAAHALAAQAALWQKQDDKPLYLVLAMMKTKDIQAFITPLAPYIDGIICTTVPEEPLCHSAQELKEALEPYGLPQLMTVENPRDIASTEPLKNTRVLVCGSLYLAAFLPK